MSRPKQQIPLAFAVACLGIATFAGMDAVMKGLSLEIGAYNALFWRSILAALMSGVLFLWHRSGWPRTAAIKLHIWRGMVISVTGFLFFWGLKYLPVAEAIGLTFIAPLLAMYLAAIMLRESISRRAVMASIIGVCGAVIVIAGRLSGNFGENAEWGIAAVMTSAMTYSYNLILQRRQARVANTIEISFFHNCTVMVLFGLLAPFLATPPSLALVPNLTAAAVLGLISLQMMSFAYARAPASTLLPIEYTAFIWAALFGWLMFAETVTITTVLGIALIVSGCLVAAWKKPGQVDHIESTAA